MSATNTMQRVYEEVVGTSSSSHPKLSLSELKSELKSHLHMTRNVTRSCEAFRELTEEDVLQIFREVLVEEVMES
jgi:hypothetical protein